MKWYYVSLVDLARPKGERFVGGVFLRAENAHRAEYDAKRIACSPPNPPLEAMVIAKPPSEPAPKSEYTNRLLSKEQIAEATGEEVRSVGEWADD